MEDMRSETTRRLWDSVARAYIAAVHAGLDDDAETKARLRLADLIWQQPDYFDFTEADKVRARGLGVLL